MQEGILHDVGYSVVAEPAGTVPCIFVLGQAFAQFDLARVSGRQAFEPVQLLPPSCDEGFGHGVVQTKGDGLDAAGHVNVGKITAGMPRG